MALCSLCIHFINSFGLKTCYWLLRKAYYSLFLKKCLWPCLGLSMYLSYRINWIISSFPHRISKILFVLGSWNDFEGLGCRIGTGYFFWYLNFWRNTVIWLLVVPTMHLDPCSLLAAEIYFCSQKKSQLSPSLVYFI